MREILFRGKRVDNGEWVEGFYFQEAGHFIKEKPSSVGTNTYLVYKETVEQYTGLNDKNGKKIFENDIVRYIYEPGKGYWNANQLSVVAWGKVGYTFDGIKGTNKYALMSGSMSAIPFDQEANNIPEFEVVGHD